MKRRSDRNRLRSLDIHAIRGGGLDHGQSCYPKSEAARKAEEKIRSHKVENTVHFVSLVIAYSAARADTLPGHKRFQAECRLSRA
jgi:hypothetical protein